MDDIFDSLPDNSMRRPSSSIQENECREAMSYFGVRGDSIAEETQEQEIADDDSKPIIVGEDVKAKMKEILEEISGDEREEAQRNEPQAESHHCVKQDEILQSLVDDIKRQTSSQSHFKGSTVSINIQADHDSKFNHTPHDLFIQLNELHGSGEYQEWRETARWIKYEENVEEGADRWGRPHVPSLSFHSLLNVRRCLETGVVLLDVEEKDLSHIVFRAVETVNR